MKLILSITLFCYSSFLVAATSVVARPLQELLISAESSAPATVINDDHAKISSQLAARVNEVLVRSGDAVAAGQRLISLDCRDFQLASTRAASTVTALQAQIRLAQQQLRRAEKLLQQNSTSRELRDQRKAELQSLQAQRQGAQAGYDEAELAVSRCTILAPSDGIITERRVATGNQVSPGTTLLSILNNQLNEVSALLTSDQIASLKQASAIEYRFNNQSYPLTLRTVIPLVDNRTRTQVLRFTFTAGLALAGSSGRLIWQEPSGRLPVRYIVSRKGQLGVMLYQDGAAEFSALPDAIEGQATITDLPGDSLIIIEGQHGITSGAAVNRIE